MSRASVVGEWYYLDDKEEQVRSLIPSSPRSCLPTSNVLQWGPRAWRQSGLSISDRLTWLVVLPGPNPPPALPRPSPLLAMRQDPRAPVHVARVSPLLCAPPLL